MAVPGTTHVLIPVKAFSSAKRRLARSLSASERAELAREMASGVVAAASEHPTWIVCDDRAVATWARAQGASVSWQPGAGLNGALANAARERFADDAHRVVVVHSDLPLISSLDALVCNDDAVVLAPDRHGSGTNGLCTPTADFHFTYGPDSFRRHLAEAERLGYPVRILRDEAWGWDVDEPADLAVFTTERSR